MTRVPSVAARCAAYGIAAEVVDGNDVEAVFGLAEEAAARCRGGEGPFLIEAETYRWHGHYEGDGQEYKPEEEAEAWRARDPLEVAGARLAERGEAGAEELERVRDEAAAQVEAAIERARSLPAPDPSEAYADVYGATEAVTS